MGISVADIESAAPIGWMSVNDKGAFMKEDGSKSKEGYILGTGSKL
jgi:hypothetical protein